MRKLQYSTAIILIIFAACAHKKIVEEADGENYLMQPPKWLMNLPKDKEVIYAVGSAGKSYYAQDSKEQALDKARVELARSIQVNVKSLFVNVETSSRSAFTGNETTDEYTVEVSQSVSAIALSGSEAVAFWFDGRGVVGPAETTYALIRLPKSTLVEQLQDIAEDVGRKEQKSDTEIQKMKSKLGQIK